MDVRLFPVLSFCAVFNLIHPHSPVHAQEQQLQAQNESRGPEVRCNHSRTRENVTLLEGVKSGKFTNYGMVEDMKSCIDKCCQARACDLAFKLGDVCYGVVCKSRRSCSILPAKEPNSFGKVDISRVYRRVDASRNGDKGRSYPNVFESSGILPSQYSALNDDNFQNHEVKPIEKLGDGKGVRHHGNLQNEDRNRVEKSNRYVGSASMNKKSSVQHSDILQNQIADIEHNKKLRENITFMISNELDKIQLQSLNPRVGDKIQNDERSKSQNSVPKLSATDSSQNNEIDKSPEKTSENSAPTDPSAEENIASTCSFYPPVFKKTIMGGLRRREEVKLLGTGFTDPDDCAAKCCRRENCKAAVINDNKCYAVQCRTRGYCDGHDTNDADAVIIYVKSRDGETLDRRERCRRHCGSGTCVNDDTCVCDTGVIGEHCERLEPACARRCGRHGFCNSTSDSCVCEEGWEGPTCDNQIVCDPPCKNGTCVDAYTNACKCNVGWSGVFCHEVNGDTRVMASTGEQVLFTDADVEPELAIKIPAEKPPLSERAEPVSAFTVAACCAMASLFLGVVVVIGMMKQIVNKRNAMTREYLEKAQLIN